MNGNPSMTFPGMAELEKSASYMYALGDRHDLDNHASLPLLVRLLPFCSDPALVDFLARLQGRITVPAPASTGHADLCRLADVVEAFGTLVRFHAKAISDGTLTAEDAAQYEGHANRLVRDVLSQVAYVHGEAARTAAVPFRKVSA